MVRRSTKLEFHKHRVTCPYCRGEIIVYSVMEVLLAARRICPKCKREMMIDRGKAVRLPPKQVRSRISKAQNG